MSEIERAIYEMENSASSPEMRKHIIIATQALHEKQEREAEPQGWIKCSERLPKERHYVLVDAPMFRNIFECCLIDGEWVFAGTWSKIGQPITHWMPLPKPPKEG